MNKDQKKLFFTVLVATNILVLFVGIGFGFLIGRGSDGSDLGILPETGSNPGTDIRIDRETGAVEYKQVNQTEVFGNGFPEIGVNEYTLISFDAKPVRATYKLIPYNSSQNYTTGRIKLSSDEYYGYTNFDLDITANGPHTLIVTSYFDDSTKSEAQFTMHVGALANGEVPVSSFNIADVYSFDTPIDYAKGAVIEFEVEPLPSGLVALPVDARIEIIKPDGSVEVFEKTYSSYQKEILLDLVTDTVADQQGVYQVEISLSNTNNVYGPSSRSVLLNVK
ncbi:hypothetical protein KC909_03075 [Candidatus Dojkabacteria bacterium]|uniref:Uncharacterized protein n=1 Tax=Candidatus Dojkabacteria bacterium TaxID=2099670 RepID=A0A955RJ12_9BACT|nr:hypothetical protein [Candidatus Dojkabacteria bacterium]